MDIQAIIKQKFERNQKALQLKPSLGLGTAISKTKISGLTCESTEGPWSFTTDMPEQMAGTAAGPTPGVLGRAALGSCLAMGYMLWASKMEIEINSLEVEVQTDYDDGALLDTSTAFPGYFLVRYVVHIESTASEATIKQLLDKADAHSPYLDVFSRGQNCVRQTKIITPKS